MGLGPNDRLDHSQIERVRLSRQPALRVRLIDAADQDKDGCRGASPRGAASGSARVGSRAAWSAAGKCQWRQATVAAFLAPRPHAELPQTLEDMDPSTSTTMSTTTGGSDAVPGRARNATL